LGGIGGDRDGVEAAEGVDFGAVGGVDFAGPEFEGHGLAGAGRKAGGGDGEAVDAGVDDFDAGGPGAAAHDIFGAGGHAEDAVADGGGGEADDQVVRGDLPAAGLGRAAGRGEDGVGDFGGGGGVGFEEGGGEGESGGEIVEAMERTSGEAQGETELGEIEEFADGGLVFGAVEAAGEFAAEGGMAGQLAGEIGGQGLAGGAARRGKGGGGMRPSSTARRARCQRARTAGRTNRGWRVAD
jgi:hypothetical protein